MKKSHLRSTIWIALTVFSLACYGYLNHFTPEAELVYSDGDQIEEINEEQEPSVFLPDIALVKKLINITKIVIPKE